MNHQYENYSSLLFYFNLHFDYESSNYNSLGISLLHFFGEFWKLFYLTILWVYLLHSCCYFLMDCITYLMIYSHGYDSRWSRTWHTILWVKLMVWMFGYQVESNLTTLATPRIMHKNSQLMKFSNDGLLKVHLGLFDDSYIFYALIYMLSSLD